MDTLYIGWLEDMIKHLKSVSVYQPYPYNLIFEAKAEILEYALRNYIDCWNLKHEHSNTNSNDANARAVDEEQYFRQLEQFKGSE